MSYTVPMSTEQQTRSTKVQRPTGAQQSRRAGEHIPQREFGIILWILIGILGCLLVGLFLWYGNLPSADQSPSVSASRPSAAENQEPETRNAVADVQIFATMSTSDTLPAIEADLESTPLDSLAAERTAIEAELGIAR